MFVKLTKVALIALFFTCSAAQAKEHVVTQKDTNFDVKELSVKVGDSVKFVNADTKSHHLMFKDSGKKVSEKQKKGGDPYTHTFGSEQKTTVRCAIHPKMKLKINVTK